MSNIISAMYARKNFGKILNEVSLLKETFTIERAGKPMAEIVPIDGKASGQVDVSSLEVAVEKLIKRIKGPRSKKLDKAIEEVRKLVEEIGESKHG